MNKKSKGRRSEYKSKTLMEDNGYVCTRSAASNGTFDLVCFRKDSIILLQVKSGRWPGRNEIKAVVKTNPPLAASSTST